MSLGALVPIGLNLVVNGGFEDYASCPNAFWCIRNNDSYIAPWYMAKGSTEYELDMNIWPAAEGLVSMDLSANGPTSVGQNIPTIAGKAYQMTFQLNRSPCGDSTNHTGTLEVTGAPIYHFWHRSPEKNGWTYESYEFTANSNSTTLIFSSTTTTVCGPVIDDVKMFLLGPAESSTSSITELPTSTSTAAVSTTAIPVENTTSAAYTLTSTTSFTSTFSTSVVTTSTSMTTSTRTTSTFAPITTSSTFYSSRTTTSVEPSTTRINYYMDTATFRSASRSTTLAIDPPSISSAVSSTTASVALSFSPAVSATPSINSVAASLVYIQPKIRRPNMLSSENHASSSHMSSFFLSSFAGIVSDSPLAVSPIHSTATPNIVTPTSYPTDTKDLNTLTTVVNSATKPLCAASSMPMSCFILTCFVAVFISVVV